MGSIGILSVGAGDTKLVFDKNNPAECIRAARIVKDMLRRGYALMIEIGKGKNKKYTRVLDFKEGTYEYIIADFDPEIAAKADKEEANVKTTDETVGETPSDPPGNDTPGQDGHAGKGRRIKTRAVPATGARGVAVGRTSGG